MAEMIAAHSEQKRPRPLASLVASAKRITSRDFDRPGHSRREEWQDDAWEMYDLVGEQRFLANTLAGRMAQARLYIGKFDSSKPDEPPAPVSDGPVAQVLSTFGGSAAARGQMLLRLGINLFIAGDGWVVGIPKEKMPNAAPPDRANPLDVFDQEPSTDLPGIDQDQLGVIPEGYELSDLEWRVLSVNEVSFVDRERVRLLLGETAQEQLEANVDEVYLVRVWRPHPRRWWQADSPTRSSLPVLRELVGLTMHVSAQIDSRLAGAGVVFVPQSALAALRQAAGLTEEDSDPFLDALMEAMLTPIRDRSSASAIVPLLVTVPDEVTEKFVKMNFATQLDEAVESKTDQAIRRLALGEDCPPELLLGMATMNHWGAWLVREDVVTTHLEPPLALVCDALTTQYLWPVLDEQGIDEAHQYVIWYDVSHLIQRPNKFADAKQLYADGVLSDEAYRKAGGFADDDAPKDIDRPVELAIQVAIQNPNLIDNIPEIIQAFRQALAPGGPLVEAAPVIDVAPEQEPTSPPAETGAQDSGPPTEAPEAVAASVTANTYSVTEDREVDEIEIPEFIKARHEPARS